MTKTFSAVNRDKMIKQMERQSFDLLIIGGGITGAGIALDAQSRGMRTALLEMQDFAAGTSSRSTKLVHGGLRYLKQFEIKLVAEVGKERAVVYENGPHVTVPEWMLLPIYRDGTFGRFSTSIGLRLYDFLAGVKKKERRKMLSRGETEQKEPMLRKDGLKGGGYYVEYRTDDARLTIEVMKKAVSLGAAAVNYLKVEDFLYEGGKAVGVQAVDMRGGSKVCIYAKKIVNAAGPWVDQLREKDGSKKGKTLHLTKGVHLVFDSRRFPLRQAVYFDTPDGRMVFAIPRDNKTYVGTTDTDYRRDIANPKMTARDRDYLLNAVNAMFPDAKLTAVDVESSWCGLRPLIHEEGKDPSEISRKDEIFHSASGLITIAGGKLTGYRKMAETIVNEVARQLEAEELGPYGRCRTANIPISGGDFGGSHHFPEFLNRKLDEASAAGIEPALAERLTRRYGTNVDLLFAALKTKEPKNPEGVLPQDEHEWNPSRQMEQNLDTPRSSTGKDGQSNVPIDQKDQTPVSGGMDELPQLSNVKNGLPRELSAMLNYSVEHEMTVTLSDFFIRRTGALFFDIGWVRQNKDAAAEAMGKMLNWSDEEKSMQLEELERHLTAAAGPEKDEA